MEFYSGQKISGVSAREKTDSMTYNNSSVPIMAEVTILTTNTSKLQQDLLATALAGSITRPMSTSSSLVDSSRLIADDQHFVGESTNNQQHDMIISGSIKHYGEHDCAGGARAYSPASANHPTEKTYCYSDEEGDEDEEGDDDVLASGNRLSRRHSSAGIVPLSLRSTSSSSNAIDTDVLLATDGRAGVSRSASRRCRIDEEQRNQSTIAIARPALINNNVGNWLNVPGAPVDIGKKTMKKKNNAFTSIEQQMERLELVQTPALVVGAAAASMRNQSHSQRHHHQQNHRSSNCVESSQLLVRHQQSSQHVRSQSVRVAPSGSKFAPTAPNRNNNTSPINQQQHKLIFDYNTSSSIQQQSIGKVRPRGTSLPGTNRAIALADVGITTGINADEVAAQQQQQYCDKREDDEADYYLLRHFIVHGKSNKVVNRGDSFRRSLRAHPKQQNSSAVSQHSSTSSIRLISLVFPIFFECFIWRVFCTPIKGRHKWSCSFILKLFFFVSIKALKSVRSRRTLTFASIAHQLRNRLYTFRMSQWTILCSIYRITVIARRYRSSCSEWPGTFKADRWNDVIENKAVKSKML